jgi:hypothetical protein
MSDETTNPGPLFKKLAAVMGQVPALKKSGWNDHFKFHYMTTEDVSNMLRPLLAEAGLVIIPSIKSGEFDSKHCSLEMEFLIGDAESGQTLTLPWKAEAIDSSDKGINKAVTTGFKYFLIKTFMIGEAGPDSDGAGPDSESVGSGKKPAFVKLTESRQAKLTEYQLHKSMTPEQQEYLQNVIDGVHQVTREQLKHIMATCKKQMADYDAFEEPEPLPI